MAKRGPQKKTKALKGLAIAAPPCPDFLGESGKALWARVCAQMLAVSTITESDEHIILKLCQASEEFEWADQVCKKHGRTVETLRGTPMERPEVGIRNKNFVLFVDCLKTLGLTPTARRDVEAIATKKGDPLEAFTR